MNPLASAVRSAPDALTANGAATFSTSLSAIVDLFFVIGSANLKTTPTSQLASMFEAAFAADEDRAIRMLLWARDIREGAGRREVFRRVLVELARTRSALVERLIPFVPEMGRWDDLLIFSDHEDLRETEALAFREIAKALGAKNGLCAKWMPRQGRVAERLRDFLQIRKHGVYRRMLVSLSQTVEQQMSARKWEDINFSHVPSVASVRYAKAFHAHDPKRYEEWRNDLKVARETPDKLAPEKKDVKVNVGAVYPHDLVMALNGGDAITANEQWERLPNFTGDQSVMAVVDVSESMTQKVQGRVTAMDISLSLGIYCADKNKGPFAGLFMTFDDHPSFVDLRGATTLDAKYRKARASKKGYSTNVQAALALLLKTAKTSGATSADLPQTLLFISDMEFNAPAWAGATNFQAMAKQFADAGYTMPSIVFWNVNARQGNNPVRFDQTGVALVSGFSPTILKSILSGEGYAPIDMVDAVIMKDRYDINKVAP